MAINKLVERLCACIHAIRWDVPLVYRYLLGVCLFGAGLAACGGAAKKPQSVLPAPEKGARHQRACRVEFGNRSNGSLGIEAKSKNCLTSQRDSFNLTCSYTPYRLTSLAPEGDYELSFTSTYHSSDGGNYSVWLDGTWNDGQVAGTELSFDIRGSLSLLDQPRNVTLLSIGANLRGEIQVRIVRSGERLAVFVDGKPLMSRAVPRSGRELGFLSRNGTPRVAQLVLKPVSAQTALYLAQCRTCRALRLPKPRRPSQL